MNLRDAVTLSLLPRGWRLRQPDASGVTSELAVTFDVLAACARSGESSDSVFARLLTALDAGCDVAAVLRRLRDRAATAIARGETARLSAWPARTALYPSLLALIYDPPPVLWVRGRLPATALEQPTVAVVGSRAASPYALEVATRLGSELASHGVIVVSGLARGVDSAAHRGALDAGGQTVAVLGCGADRVYPSEHRKLAAAIAVDGALISEFTPGTPPLARHFPLRNRIISGLSRAVVVVEACEKSGSLITAACAAEQGREVMAVPGNVLSGRNKGAHALLKDGAKIVESSDDILEELGLNRAGDRSRPSESACDDVLLRVMSPGEAYDLDDLAGATGLAGVTLLPRLVELELSGAIRRLDGARFVRSKGAVL